MREIYFFSFPCVHFKWKILHTCKIQVIDFSFLKHIYHLHILLPYRLLRSCDFESARE